MNVGDYSTVCAAQIAAAHPRRSTLERSEGNAAARRARRDAEGRDELRPVVEISPGSKVGDEKNRRNDERRPENQAKRRVENSSEKRRLDERSDVPRRFWESWGERAGSASFRESTTPPNDELGKFLDVFC